MEKTEKSKSHKTIYSLENLESPRYFKIKITLIFTQINCS